MKQLVSVLQNIDYKNLSTNDPSLLQISDITSDSREAKKNSLFVALRGELNDGHTFVKSAIANGCKVVVVEKDRFIFSSITAPDVCILEVADSRIAYGEIARNFYDNPQDHLKFVGITGTNGKTTITYLLEHILAARKERVGVIGTVNYRFTSKNGEKQVLPAPFTTPEPALLQKLLRMMVDNGVTTVVMEVSSHALVQERLGDIKYDVAAFTNLSHDHLDYHNSMEEYFEAKKLLFTHHLKDSGTAVITHRGGQEEARYSEILASFLKEQGTKVFEVGDNQDSSITPNNIEVTTQSTKLRLRTDGGEFSLSTPLVGRFNVDNIITSLGIALVLGVDANVAVQSLHTAAGAPGRLERVMVDDEVERASVFVDYAHTPDALLNVLSTLKKLPHEKLICVFGCGGDRDKAKRPEMGRIASEYCDVVIITDDNPRSESPEEILGQIVKGIDKGRMKEKKEILLSRQLQSEAGYVVISDRKEAIYNAVTYSGPKDIVLVAGKGHEKYQLTNDGKRFFDDCLEVREAQLSWSSISISKALGLTPASTNIYFSGVSTDSRDIKEGELFVALKGENFDGHSYIGQAKKSGAKGFVISDSTISLDDDVEFFKVEDCLKGLGDLAAYRRKKIGTFASQVVVGITGSCGKTTVKEMVNSIFEQNWPNSPACPVDRVLKTKGNFNNLIGLPLSLLPLQLKHKAAILEMGMNRPGEIAELTRIADPDICCIVNVHGAHLEGLGSIEGVAKAKGEIFDHSREESTHIVNLDDDLVVWASQDKSNKKITFTTKKEKIEHANIWATDISVEENGSVSYYLNIGAEKEHVTLSVPGKHNVANSLAAAAISHGASVNIETIAKGLVSFRSVDKRLQVVKAKAGYLIINDTYNANPASMVAGLETLVSMGDGKKIAVLGDMLELGDASDEAHVELGKKAAESELDFLGLVGSFASCTSKGAIAGGMPKKRVRIFKDKNEAADFLQQMETDSFITEETSLLVKASRGLALESIVERLRS